jgi:formamidopyrimidine-DNA glycosylase
MPSLPELEVDRLEFAGRLIGKQVTHIDALDYRDVRVDVHLLSQDIEGHPCTGVARYGKWFYLEFEAQPNQLIFHLGLTGKLTLIALDGKLPRAASMTLDFDNNIRLVLGDARHLGRVYWRPFQELKAEKMLGPDLLAVDERYFMSVVPRKRRAVRDVIMDQKIIAGIGGKYADEALWRVKVHPNTKCDKIAETTMIELFEAAQDITKTAIELGADVEKFPDSWLIPHRHTDRRCPRCGSELTVRKLGGSETYYCPVDQPAPMPFRSG